MLFCTALDKVDVFAQRYTLVVVHASIGFDWTRLCVADMKRQLYKMTADFIFVSSPLLKCQSSYKHCYNVNFDIKH